jgi:hypothetical protein
LLDLVATIQTSFRPSPCGQDKDNADPHAADAAISSVPQRRRRQRPPPLADDESLRHENYGRQTHILNESYQSGNKTSTDSDAGKGDRSSIAGDDMHPWRSRCDIRKPRSSEEVTHGLVFAGSFPRMHSELNNGGVWRQVRGARRACEQHAWHVPTSLHATAGNNDANDEAHVCHQPFLKSAPICRPFAL